MRVEHDPAADRHGRRVRPEDEPVAPREHRGRLEPNPREGSGAGRHAVRRLPGEQRHAGEQFGGALVEAHPRAVFQRPCARKQFHARVDHPRRLEQVRRHERLPTRHLLHLHASQVHGRPLASDDLLPAFTVHLQAAQLDRAVARQQQELVILADATGHEGAGHDRAKAFHREGAVDRQSRRTVDGSGHGLTRDSDERAAQRVEPLPGARRHRDHHRGFERCSLQKVGHLQANQLHGLVVHEVRLRERHDAPGHAEQPADLEVLAGLRHDGLVSRHHQQTGLQDRHRLIDDVVLVGLQVLAPALFDQLDDPPGIEVDAEADAAAAVLREVLDREPQAARPRRPQHQPVGASREEFIRQRVAEDLVVGPEVVDRHAGFRGAGRPARFENEHRFALEPLRDPPLHRTAAQRLVLELRRSA